MVIVRFDSRKEISIFLQNTYLANQLTDKLITIFVIFKFKNKQKLKELLIKNTIKEKLIINFPKKIKFFVQSPNGARLLILA